MIQKIAKKFILTSFLFINFIQTSKSANLQNIDRSNTNINTQFSWLKISNKITPSTSAKLFNNNFFPYKKFIKKDADQLSADISKSKKELVIQSDKQSEINGFIYAEGNVSITYRGIVLKADNLIYDKSNKKISAEGNISLIIGDQIFKISQLEYSFISETGYLLNIEGFLNTNTFIDDLLSNFSSSDISKIENLLELRKKKILHTPGRVDNWIFSTDKMTIDGKIWKRNQSLD